MRAPCFCFITTAFLCLGTLQAADRAVEPILSHIRRVAVESSALTSVGYSKRLHALEIEFHDGLIYRYLGVAPVTYRELLAANSKARYYNHHLRGKYRCLRVKPRDNS